MQSRNDYLTNSPLLYKNSPYKAKDTKGAYIAPPPGLRFYVLIDDSEYALLDDSGGPLLTKL